MKECKVCIHLDRKHSAVYLYLKSEKNHVTHELQHIFEITNSDNFFSWIKNQNKFYSFRRFK